MSFIGTPSDPEGMGLDEQGNIYVADGKKGVVQFDKEGNFVAYLAAGNNVLKDVYFPTGVAVHNTGRLYICEEANGRILVYKPKPGLKATIPLSIQ